MAALKGVSWIAEEERARRHQFGTGRGSILERATQHDSHRCSRVLLFECAISRPGGADHLVDGPILIGGEKPRLLRSARRQTVSATRVFDRNFCQDASLLPSQE